MTNRSLLEERDEPLVLLPRELSIPPQVSLVGQKALRLVEASVLKARVPRFGVVTRVGFDLHLGQREIAWLLEDAVRIERENPAQLASWCARLERAVASLPLPDELEWSLEELVSSFTDDDLLAVRPSVIVDDVSSEALAGVFETFLFVRGLEAVREAVRAVYASAFSTVVVARRRDHGLPPFDSRLAIVIQRMVDAEVSGRVRSLSNEGANSRSPTIEIMATLGNAGGMSRVTGTGRLSYDLARVARPTLADDGFDENAAVEMERAVKATALRFDDHRGQGTRLVPIDDTSQNDACLTVDQARVVAREALRLEVELQRPVEIEFALAGRLVSILGMRPVFAPRTRIESQRLRVFDERLLPESVRGVSTVLTTSVVMSTFVPAFTRALELLGGAPDALDEQRSVRGRLLGLLSGRIFVHTSALRSFLELLPEGRVLREGLARATGATSLVEGSPPPPPPDDDVVSISRFLKTARRAVDESERALFAHRQDLRALEHIDARPLDPDELVDLLDRALAQCRHAESHHVALWLAAHAGYGTLMRLSESWFPNARPGFVQDLFSPGDGDDEPEVVTALARLARIVRESDVLARVFADESDPVALWDRLEDAPFAETFREVLVDVLPVFGTRFIAGRKLEAPGLNERLDLIIELVSRLAHDTRNQSWQRSQAKGYRKKAEVAAADDLHDRRLMKGLSSRRKVFDRTLEETRRALHARDRYATFTLDVMARLRTIVLALGDRLFEHGLLAQPRDVFSLSVGEIRGLVRGHALDGDVRPLVAARKRAYTLAPPTYPAAVEMRGLLSTVAVEEVTDPTRSRALFEGFPASSGDVAGVAVKLSVDEASRGFDVMTGFRVPPPGGVVIVARADIALLPILSLADAVVIDRGSPLSPLVAMLRRQGIPCVAGAEGMHHRILDGERIHVDGRTGTVTLLDRASDPNAASSDIDADSFARLAAPTDPTITALSVASTAAPRAPTVSRSQPAAPPPPPDDDDDGFDDDGFDD